MMTLHSGFLSYYGPVMEMIRPYLRDPDYASELESMRLRSWTFDAKSSSATIVVGSGIGGTAVRSSTARLVGVGVGLENVGNTCYANSLLQALHHCVDFKIAVMAKMEMNSARLVCRQLARVFSMLDSEPRSFPPRDFLKTLPEQYRVGDQQDVAEFGKHLLDLVERELGTDSMNFFTGKIQSSVTCSLCKCSTVRTESFTDLSLSFPLNAKDPLTLADMVKFAFQNVELMTGDNQFKCSKCDKLVDATLSGERKRFFIFFLMPFVFLITLPT